MAQRLQASKQWHGDQGDTKTEQHTPSACCLRQTSPFISGQGGVIENVRIYRSSLEDVFMKLTGKSLQDKGENIENQKDLLDV